ncbi:MAG TPA: glycosyl transferase [Rectinemataceae bacterium]|nr:glycosyl transferase [Rectinemataceae bacterium]
MKYGYFDDEKREFVITRPDTPLPWLNYLGQDDLFGLCTNTAGGYSFWKDSRLRRLTRYRYNNVPYDLGGRYLYVNDGGSVWNPGWKPVKAPLDRYECRHGLGYTRILGEKEGLEIELLFFVPPAERAELWRVRVLNKSGVRKRPRLFSYQEFCFYEALNDMSNFQRTWSIGEVEVEGSAIYHTTEYRERRNHYTMFACTRPVAGFDTDRDAFVGVHEGLHEAAVPFSGACTGSMAAGWNPIGAHEVDLDLAPGQEEVFGFVLAYVEQVEGPKFEAPRTVNKEAGRAVLQRFAEPTAMDAAFGELASFWEGLLGAFQARIPNEHAERMLNTWNQYQCMATFNLSRSTSMFETGIGRGMGFRDSNQDLLGFVHMIPERARERLLDIAATQLSDGTCYHQYQPLTKKGNAEVGGDFYDDHLWLVLATCAYIRETGDLSILDEGCGYADLTYAEGGPKESLLHHLETSLAYTMSKRGPHGLPLIGHADWNDCLNLNCFSTEPNESFQTAGDVRGSTAESVMIAGLFLYAARELAGLYDFMDRGDEATRVRAAYAEMLDAVEGPGWDGLWYRRAYDAKGNPVGSGLCDEGKIFIESQGWCVLGGAGGGEADAANRQPGSEAPGGTDPQGRARTALESVHRELYTRHGVILQQPAYSTYRVELGEVSSYPPGFKENAGIFCHNNTWIQLAWCLLGEGDRAMEYYLSICPSAKQAEIDTYRAEPYVYAQMIAGRDSARFGEAKNSWLTGTAAWSFVALSQGILGIKPDYRGLRLEPCIPRGWKGYSATRRYRRAIYRIEVRNEAGVCTGIRSVHIDGRPVELKKNGASGARSVLLPCFPAGSEHRIEIDLGT